MKIEERLEELVRENGVYNLFEGIKLEDYFKISEGKKRNILINLIKYLKNNKKKVEEEFSETEIKKSILSKKIDYYIYKDTFFEEDSFYLNQIQKSKIKEYLTKIAENQDCIAEEVSFKKVYIELKEMLENGKYNYENFNKLIKEGIEFAKKLHWKYLPIYNEQTMKNRGCLPEDNIEEYYNHYHTIEDLYEEIMGNGIKFNLLNGDETLGKEIDFKVYTVRWNGYDTYRVSRTIYGWEVNHISVPSETLKDGTGGLFNNLKHDFVFFPEAGVANAMENIWEWADNGELSLDELKEKLQEIAVWISDVEKNMRVKQPKWCNYY